MRFYEEDIKKLILEKRRIFLGDDDNTPNIVLFEKGISINSVICDCLIFSEGKGIIGLEIKTERDSTRRLNKQLKAYSVTCDYVYTLCHDDHVEKVEEIINRNHPHVGIIAYSEFRGVPILGVYKEAHKSPKKDVKMAYQMLWYTELSALLGNFKRQMNTLEEFGVRVNTMKSRSGGASRLYVQSNAGKYLKKTDVINMIVNRLGYQESNKLLCNIFINDKFHPERNLKFHHFKNKS